LDTMRAIYERLAPAPDGHVRTVYNAAGTYTGRLSSAGAFYVPASTNLQNLPAMEAARDPLFKVRECIVPDDGEVFLYVDLCQAEAKIVACLTEEPELLELDQHRWIASMLYDKPMEAVTAHERQVGKASHKINYGIGAKRLWQDINAVADITGISVTLTQAKTFLANVHAKRPKLDGVWWNRVERQIKECGWIETVFGRRCNFYPRLDFETGELDAETLRAAVAFEPQSTVADLKTLALLEAFEKEGGS